MSQIQHQEKQEEIQVKNEEEDKKQVEQVNQEVQEKRRQKDIKQHQQSRRQQDEENQQQVGREEQHDSARDHNENQIVESKVYQDKDERQKTQDKYCWNTDIDDNGVKQSQSRLSDERVEQERQHTIERQPPIFKKSQAKKTFKAKIPQQLKTYTKSQNVAFDQLLRQTLMSNKLIRVIFIHFCKENNLMSIKSSLFEDKQKKMQEMSLNKWMVFCKEFQIYAKLCSIKSSAQEAKLKKEQLLLQTSQVRQFHRVKQAKQAQKILMGIFKYSNKNASKINFHSFVIAISNLFHEFKLFYAQDSKGINQFLCEVMHCSDEKTCYKKLSHLKFTTATPQIEYNKISFPEGQVKSRVKTKPVLSHSKQNYESCLYTLQSANKSKTLTRNYTQLNLNPVLFQAKKSVNESNLYSKRALNYKLSMAKLTSKTEQVLKEKDRKMGLIEYFQATKDPILDSYFILQGGKRLCQTKL